MRRLVDLHLARPLDCTRIAIWPHGDLYQNADTMAAAAALQCSSPPMVSAVDLLARASGDASIVAGVGVFEESKIVDKPRSDPPADLCAATVSLETELWYM